jgi:hypothetical protein
VASENKTQVGVGFTIPDPKHEGKLAIVFYCFETDTFMVYRGATAEVPQDLPVEVPNRGE